MSRWKAAALHLGLSALIGVVAALLIFVVWYPAPYGHAAGAEELVLLLLGVDLVLGPLLTLVVFRVGKPGLRFDLCLIALLQACAFFYGMSVVVRARPAYLVASVDRFVLVSATDLKSEDLAQASAAEFRHVPWGGPKVICARLPVETSALNDLAFSGLAGKDIELFPKYYVAYAACAHDMLKRAQTLENMRLAHPAASDVFDGWLRRSHRNAASVVGVPMRTPRAELTMLLDAADGSVLEALPVDTW